MEKAELVRILIEEKRRIEAKRVVLKLPNWMNDSTVKILQDGLQDIGISMVPLLRADTHQAVADQILQATKVRLQEYIDDIDQHMNKTDQMEN